jgi:YD repeat-containing protein
VRRLRSTDVGRQVLDFLPTLRPAWWVVRAWVLVRALEIWTGYGNTWHQYALIPKVHDSRTIGFVVLAVAIPVSVYLGRRGFRGGRQRGLMIAGEAALGLFAFAIVVNSLADANRDADGTRPVAYTGGFATQPGLSENGTPITNLYVYDKDGKLVDGAFVYDQYGRPVSVARPDGNDGNGIGVNLWVDANGNPVINRYPQQLMQAQLDGADNIAGFVRIAPPNVVVPKGVHQPTGDGMSEPSQDSATPSATPATTTPGGATEAHGSSTPSAPPSTPANPGAKG